ncbi:hypothetical protein L195_g057869, partial [Trifolium pratense]
VDRVVDEIIATPLISSVKEDNVRVIGMIFGKLNLLTKRVTYSRGCVGGVCRRGPRMLVGRRPVTVAAEYSLPTWNNRRQGVSNVQK